MTHVYDATGHVAAAAERATLEAFLDHQRDEVKAKVRGLSDDDARRRLVPSATTLAGLLKHLQRVEASWFQHRLDQMPAEELPPLQWLADGPDGDFVVGPDETVASVTADYDAQCAVSRATAARHHLDEVVPHPSLGEVSLRWIYVHMIEETARHAGHADILREQLDAAAATGR
jgi:uncharacterized damage-inducible protein DinB